ncbi:hypothetical protein Vretimale_15683 [Volvox reticuliferus]|uniref:Uncharacterized protein n=1 Tax=Volvox reticuliferus TaxID=1737510 RepID=A0A8J4GR90_9CHLO|nr:hypothetical protein Vretimale_15683 [Volvox reticuliferus]
MQVGRWVGTAAVANVPLPPPQQPSLHAAPATTPGSRELAVATRILESIPRVRAVRELRGVLQEAQEQGCLTSAHSVAAIMQLGNMAATFHTPGEAEDARQLGGQLLGRLKGQQQSLPLTLRGHVERAAVLLGVRSESDSNLGSSSPSQSSSGGKEQPELGFESLRSSVAPQPAARQPPRKRHKQVKPPQEPDQHLTTMQPRFLPHWQRPEQETQGQQQQKQAQHQEQKQKQQPLQPRQQRQLQRLAAAAAEPGTTASPSDPSSLLVRAMQQRLTVLPVDSAEAASFDTSRSSTKDSVAATAAPAACSTDSVVVSQRPGSMATLSSAAASHALPGNSSTPPLPSPPPPLASGSGGDATAAAPTAAAAVTLTFEEALQRAWSAWRDVETSDPGQAQVQKQAGRQRLAGTLGPVAWSSVEEALQGRPPAEMSVGDIAQVVHLLAALKLMPQYDWLCAAQDRLCQEIAAAEPAVAVGSGDNEKGRGNAGAAATVSTEVHAVDMLEDLRQVYAATDELMQMCWEADERWKGSGILQGPRAVPSTASQEAGLLTRGQSLLRNQQQQRNLQEAKRQQPQPEQRGPATSSSAGDGGQRNQAATEMIPKALCTSTTAETSSSIISEGSRTTEEPAALAPGKVTAVTQASSRSVASCVTDNRGGGGEGASEAAHVPCLDGALPNDPRAVLQSSQSSPPYGAELPRDQEDRSRGTWGNSGFGLADGGDDCGGESIDPGVSLERLRALLRQFTSRGVVVPMKASRDGVDAHCDSNSSYDAAAAHAAVEELSSLLTAALRTEATSSRALWGAGATATTAADAADVSPGAKRPRALTAKDLSALVAAARGAQPAGLPRELLATAVKLLVALRGHATCEHVAPVLAACVASGDMPPSYLLEQLAMLAFPMQVPESLDSHRILTQAAVKTRQQPENAEASDLLTEPSVAFVRAVHTCGVALDRLGFRLNNRQFSDWVGSVARRPVVLKPSQVAQLMAACTERGYTVRPSGAAEALVASATQPIARLQELSCSETVAIALFAAKQGIQLGDNDGDSGNSSSSVCRNGVGTPLLQHLAPRLRELGTSEMVALLPALYATNVLSGKGATSTEWLDKHSAALLPHAEALQVDQMLPLLQCYNQLGYRPPALLQLGLSLALESHFTSAPLLPLLQALHQLLCGRLGFRPNDGLAAAVQENLLPRVMLAATKAVSAAPMSQQQELLLKNKEEGQPAGGLTMRQRLMVLEVLDAARVRPHPAQLAAMLEVELAGGEGLMAALPGDALVAVLWQCVSFRALPSWRFIGEWLQAFAAAVDAGSGGHKVSPGALARVGWCLAQMGVQPEGGWQAVYHAALLPVLPKLTAEQLSLVAHSALLLRSRPLDEWLEALFRAALGRMKELDGPSAARLLHFAAAGDVEMSKDWMQSFFLHTLRLVADPLIPESPSAQSSHRFSDGADPNHVALMLRALGRLGFRPPEPWLAAALERLRKGAAALSPACFPLVFMSLARLCPDLVLELGPGSVVDELVRAAYKKRGEFTFLELQWLMEALGYYPAYEMPPAAAANLLSELRRQEEALDEEAEDSNDVAISLGDAVSGSWLAWEDAVAAEVA